MLGGKAYQALQFTFAKRFVASMRAVLAAYGWLDLPANKDLKLLVTFQTAVFVNRHKYYYNSWKVRPYPRRGSLAGLQNFFELAGGLLPERFQLLDLLFYLGEVSLSDGCFLEFVSTLQHLGGTDDSAGALE